MYRDLTGRVFGRLKVLRRIRDGKANTRWTCRCVCGSSTVAITGNLLHGRHKSCGCGRKGPTAFRAKPRIVFNGYVFVVDRSHPRANKSTGRVREHILVMERKLGRHLLPGEEVHHKNGNRADNRPSNLELWIKSQPSGARVKDLLRWARVIVRRYSTTR